MKALVITGSRADRNCVEPVHEALLKAGHISILSDITYCMPSAIGNRPDIAVVGGDRSEILQAALNLSLNRIPIAHIAGGDVTEGSADDRYRDAITALSCIHFATNQQSLTRLFTKLIRYTDCAYCTGSPAIDRIKQTKVLDKTSTLMHFSLQPDLPTALVCVHPNTAGSKPFLDFVAVREALETINIQCVCLGSNADAGGDDINRTWIDWCKRSGRHFAHNVSPQLYYSLMTHCDVMIGNSSAMLYEAPSFGLPCVEVGNRQYGRIRSANIRGCGPSAGEIELAITLQLNIGRVQCDNPYGDGESAPRIVKALEEHFK